MSTTTTTITATTTEPITKVRKVKATEGSDAILKVLHEDGAVIIQEVFTPEQIRLINEDIDPAMKQMDVGSKIDDDWLKEFHGFNTKRLTGLVASSQTFRDYILDNDLMHDCCEKLFVEDSGTYWLNTAQVIEIGPGSRAQPLHRDQWQYPIFTHVGPDAPESMCNFMVALNDFTDENGATRVIPGSHQWSDFKKDGDPAETVPAEMKAGDVCFLGGKVMHGGGANNTKDFLRRGLVVVFQPSYLTLEEAHPFLVKKELVDTLSPRAQSMIGFRSQFPKNSPGVWKCEYGEMGDAIHSWQK